MNSIPTLDELRDLPTKSAVIAALRQLVRHRDELRRRRSVLVRAASREEDLGRRKPALEEARELTTALAEIDAMIDELGQRLEDMGMGAKRQLHKEEGRQKA